MDKFLYGLKMTPVVPECNAESDRVLYPGLYAHEVSEDRKKNGIPYHKEVLFWYKNFAHSMLKRKSVKIFDLKNLKSTAADIAEIELLINLIENEFPPFEVTLKEKELWQSGPFSGVLGKSSKLQ